MPQKKIAPESINLLTLIPEKNINWKRNEEGFIVLLKPKFSHPFLKKYILPRMKRPVYKITMDDIGTFLWDLIDGKKTVGLLAESFSVRFGDRVEPLYDRLSLFFQQLEKNKFIRFLNRPDQKMP